MRTEGRRIEAIVHAASDWLLSEPLIRCRRSEFVAQILVPNLKLVISSRQLHIGCHNIRYWTFFISDHKTN